MRRDHAAASAALLVEDGWQIRQHVTDALQQQGLTVLYASDGVEALIISRNSTEKVDLAVIDMEIGGQVGGLQLAEHIVRDRPGVGVLMICGDGGMAQRATEEGFASLLKPFTIPGLIQAVAEVLAAGAGRGSAESCAPAATAASPAWDERRQLEQDLLGRVQRAAEVYHGAVDSQALLDANTGVSIPAGADPAPLEPAPERVARLALDHYSRALKTFSNLIIHGRKPSCREMLESLLEAAVEATGALKGTIQVADPSEGALLLEAQHGFERPFLDFFERVSADTPVCGQALRTGRCVIVEDVTESLLFRGTRCLEVLLQAGVRATQATPLLGNRRVVGVLSTYYPAPAVPGTGDLERIQDYAAQAAALIVEFGGR